MTKLSVIIPVYNVQSTIDRCVASIVGQSYDDMEIILVDDGSTDNSPALCDSWCRKDRRIKAVHKRNGGLSDARNAGLDIATGEYVTFTDSDDFLLTPLTIPTLMDILSKHEEYDILEYPLYKHYGNKRQEQKVNFGEHVFTDLKRDYWYGMKGYTHTYACNKIFRAALFSHVKFEKGKKFEDSYLMSAMIKCARTIATTGLGMYYYCENYNGITRKADGHDLDDLLAPHLRTLVEDTGSPVSKTEAFAEYYIYVMNIRNDVRKALGITKEMPRYKPGLNILMKRMHYKTRLKLIALYFIK